MNYKYDMVALEKFLDTNDLLKIVNETLNVSKQIKICKNSSSNDKSILDDKFDELNDVSDTMSKIEEDIDCSELAVNKLLTFSGNFEATDSDINKHFYITSKIK